MPEPPSPSDFVGRVDELAAFEQAVASARAGRPAVLLVGGEAGIGKSTLVQESARRGGAALLVGRCLPMAGEVMPLAPLAELLRDITRANSTALADDISFDVLQEWVKRGRAVEGTTAGALFAPLFELIARVGRDGVVAVAFEDLHWADALSWDLFDYLARNLVDEHVVLVGTYRANEVAAHREQRRRMSELARLPATRRLLLEGLNREEVAAKIASLTGEPARAGLVDDILARGQGNPFFTAELVAAHRDGEAIPAVLSDLIAAELDGLDPAARSVARAVAVVGRDTSHDLLARVADIDADSLEMALRATVDAHLVVVDHENDSYRFRHALIGEVVYDELLPPERKRLHQRVADALAGEGSDVLLRADRASEFAFHLDRADNRVAAFTASLAAADASEGVAPAAALRHLERALALWDSVGDAAQGESRSERLWQAAELAAGAAGNAIAARLARDAFAHGAPARGAAWGHERLGRYLWGAGDIEGSSVEFAIASELLADDASPDAARVFAGLGQDELMLGRYDKADSWASRVFEVLGSPERDALAWTMARRVLGIAVDHRGEPQRGVELCREAVETAPSALTRMLALLYLGVSLLDAGRYREAVNTMLDAAVDARVTGLDVSYGGYIDALAAEGLVRLGQWSDADNVLGLTTGAEALPIGQVRLAIAGATLAAYRNDRDQTRALLEEAAALPFDPFHRWFVDRNAAECHVALGEWADASALAARALADAPPLLWRARFTMYGALADVELGLDARARRERFDVDATLARLCATIADAWRGAASNDEALDTTAHLAHAAASITRLGDADPDAWALAAQHWGRLGDPYWRAHARLREAEAAAAIGLSARAGDALREAHELAANLGAVTLLAEIDAVSKRTRLSVAAPVAVVLDDHSIDRLGLTPREAEVLSLVASGHTNRQIGEALFVSEKTASVHVSNILRKLGVTSRVDAAAVAQRLGVA